MTLNRIGKFDFSADLFLWLVFTSTWIKQFALKCGGRSSFLKQRKRMRSNSVMEKDSATIHTPSYSKRFKDIRIPV